MNILLNSLSSLSGGAVAHLRNTLPLLLRMFNDTKEHSLHIVCRTDQRQLFHSVADAQIVVMPAQVEGPVARTLWERTNLGRIAREHRIGVQFVPYQIACFAASIRQVLLLCNMEPFGYARYQYHWRLALRNWLLRRLSRVSLRKADRVVAVAAHAAKYAVEELGVQPERVRTTYLGCDSSFCPEGNTVADNELLVKLDITVPYIFTCGSLLPYRRCEDVVHAHGLAAQGRSGFPNLVIAGPRVDPCYHRTVMKAIASSPNGQVKWVGTATREQMQVLYRHAVCTVFASEIETCPNIAIEAMASGSPVIAADTPAFVEILDGACTHYARRNVGQLTEAIRNVVNNETERKRLRLAGLARAQYFSWGKCAEQTYRALTEWE